MFISYSGHMGPLCNPFRRRVFLEEVKPLRRAPLSLGSSREVLWHSTQHTIVPVGLLTYSLTHRGFEDQAKNNSFPLPPPFFRHRVDPGPKHAQIRSTGGRVQAGDL